jgi:hypothetical protein
MVESERALKLKFLDLLEEDRGFRLTLGALMGFNAILERLDRHEARLGAHGRRIEALAAELKALRTDFNEGMHAFQLRLDAPLGARWGIFAEEAFREGVEGIVVKYFGGEVQRWVHEDEAGEVFGYPASVEADLLIRDTGQALVEVKSSISRGDLATPRRKGKLYEQVEGVKPSLAIFFPSAEGGALWTRRRLA